MFAETFNAEYDIKRENTEQVTLKGIWVCKKAYSKILILSYNFPQMDFWGTPVWQKCKGLEQYLL